MGLLIFLIIMVFLFYTLPACARRTWRFATKTDLWPFDRDVTLEAVRKLTKGMVVFVAITFLLWIIVGLLPAS